MAGSVPGQPSPESPHAGWNPCKKGQSASGRAATGRMRARAKASEAGEGSAARGTPWETSGVRGFVHVQAVVERLEADAEDRGGRGLVALDVLQRGVDQLALRMRDRATDLDLERVARRRGRALAMRRRVLRTELVVGQDERALHGV